MENDELSGKKRRVDKGILDYYSKMTGPWHKDILNKE